MDLTSIEVEGLTGPHTTIPTDAPIYFRGRNGSGKSIALSLLDIALIGPSAGRWPKIGKPVAPFTVKLHLENGGRHTVQRGYTGRGALCLLDGRAPSDDKTEIAAMLGGKAGRESPTRTGRFDLPAFLGLSGPARAQWLTDHVFGGAWTLDALREELAQRGLDLDFAVREAREDNDADQPTRVALTAVAVARSAVETHAALTALIAARLSDLRGRVRTLQGAAVADEQDAMAATDLPPGTVATYEAEAETLRAQIAVIDGRTASASTAKRRRDELERAIATAIADATAAEREAEAMRAAAEEAAKRVDGELKQRVTDAETRVHDLEHQEAESKSKGKRVRTAHDDLERRLREARAAAQTQLDALRATATQAVRDATVRQDEAIGAAKAAVERLHRLHVRLSDDGLPARLRSALAALVADVESTYLGDSPTVAEHLHAARVVLAEAPAPPTAEEVAAAEQEERTTGEARRAADEALAGARAELARLGALAAVDDEDVQGIATQFEAAHRTLDAALKAHGTITTNLAEARTTLAQAHDARRTAASKVSTLRDDSAARTATATRKRESATALRNELDAITVSDIGADLEQRAALDERLRSANAAAAKLRDAEALKANARRRNDRLEAVGADAERWAAWQKAAKEARDKLVSEARDPIAELANATLKDLIGREIVIEKGDVKIRVVHADVLAPLVPAGTVYDLDAASAAEVAIVGAVLTAALQTHLGGWRVVIVDELSVIEPALRDRFVAALVDMHRRNVLDNVLLAGWDTCTVPGVRCIDLTT